MKSSPNSIIAALGVVLALALSLATASPAAAQIAGFRISNTNVDGMTGQVDFDVLLYGVTTPPPGNFRAGMPIDRTLVNSYTYTNASNVYYLYYTLVSDWNTYAPPALEFGDGATDQVITLVLQPTEGVTNLFRGSFSHTYAQGDYKIEAKVNPDGEYLMPGVETAGLTTGYAITGTLVNQFAANLTVRNTLGSTVYTFNTAYTNSYPGTIRYVKNSAEILVPGSPPVLQVTSGLCPGVATLEVSNLVPGDKVAFFTSYNPGSYDVGGACAGAIIDLDNPTLRSTRYADANGKILVTRNFPPSQCALLIQVINLGVGGSNCGTSAVVSVPTSVSGPAREEEPPTPPKPGTLRGER
jgi:hypothetical protein